MSMDDIALRTAKRLIHNNDHLKFFKKDVLKRVHGFEYEQHFRRMLIAIIGLHGVERMEKTIDPLLFDPMCAALNALKPYRDQHAHEYIKGTTLRLDAPSVTIKRFKTVYNGLINVDKVLKVIK